MNTVYSGRMIKVYQFVSDLQINWNWAFDGNAHQSDGAFWVQTNDELHSCYYDPRFIKQLPDNTCIECEESSDGAITVNTENFDEVYLLDDGRVICIYQGDDGINDLFPCLEQFEYVDQDSPVVAIHVSNKRREFTLEDLYYADKNNRLYAEESVLSNSEIKEIIESDYYDGDLEDEEDNQ